MESVILQLIKIITALYYNDISDDKDESIYDEMECIIKLIKIDKRLSSGLGNEDSVIETLRDTAEWMIYNREGGYDLDDLLQRLSINFQGNNEFIEITKNTLKSDIQPSKARKKVISILRELKYEKKKSNIKQLISAANMKLNFGTETFNIDTYKNELINSLTSIDTSSNEEISGLIGRVDFTSTESIERALSKAVVINSSEGLLNTGYRGINDACGGGVTRGYYCNFGALTHGYKSGMLLDLSLMLPEFNNPLMLNDRKKPMIYRISFENTIEQDTIILYKRLYEIKEGKKYKGHDIIVSDATEFLRRHYEQRGYTFVLEHYDPSNFTLYDLFYLFTKAISDGYEIHAAILDYPGLFAHNAFGDKLNKKIENTIEGIRNFCFPKGITTFGGHQLSTQAQQLLRDESVGHARFTKKVSTGGYYMDCQSLHTKFDLEFLLHVFEHVDGNKYLSASKGKHRFGEDVPRSLCHMLYKFDKCGGLPFDAKDETPKVLYSLPKQLDLDMNSTWE